MCGLEDVSITLSCHSVVGGAWVNIHAAVAEGWGLSALEAASCGVPTVCYDAPGLRDSVSSMKSGILVPGSKASDLADAVESILHSPAIWARTAREYSSEFTWDRCADLWHKHLLRLTSAAGSREEK